MSNQAEHQITAFPDQKMEPSLLLLCTASGRVFFASGGVRLLLGEDLTGRNLNDFLEDATVAKLVAEIVAGREMEFECTLLGRRFACCASPVENNIQIDLFPMNRDGSVFITVNSARYLVRELNGNLAAMMPALQRLQEHLTEEIRLPAAILKRNMYRLLRLSRDLEDCAEAENGLLQMHYAEEDLTALCGDLAHRLQPYCQMMQIDLSVKLPAAPLICQVDAEKVRRMILNLISNAIAAEKDGGSIVLALYQREDEATISVTDTGCGIQGDLFSDIFRKYDQIDPTEVSSTGGVGFGLALTRAFAEKHGGRFVLMSNEGGGTSAQIILPRSIHGMPDTLRAARSTYGSGLDVILVELSTVLSREAYL